MRELPKRVEILSVPGDRDTGIVLIDGVPFPFDTAVNAPIARVDFPPNHFPILWMPIAIDVDATVEHREVGDEELQRWL